jgi:phenylacetate-CoA ligase
MHVFWSEEAHRQNRRIGYRFYEMWGVDIFDRLAFLWGHGATASPRLPGRLAQLKTMLCDRLRNRIRMSAYNLSRESLREYVNQIASFRPAAIYAYSMACYLLAREAEQLRSVGDSLKLVTLTSEPASPRMIETIERVFGVPAVMEYGSIEAGYLAGEWPDRTMRVREDAVLMETLPRENDRYEIVVTVLGNPSFPLIRYAIGDMTDAPLERPDSGFAILKNIVGRSNDFIVSRSGCLLHGVRFEVTFERRSGIRRYRIHQEKDGRDLALIELVDENTPVDCKSLELEIREFVGDWPVEVAVANTIPPNRAGKHCWITSELARSRELTV